MVVAMKLVSLLGMDAAWTRGLPVWAESRPRRAARRLWMRARSFGMRILEATRLASLL